MNYHEALVPRFLETKGNSALNNFVLIASGVILISLLAQLSIPLPWTPVPITGQTFGVSLVSLLWGRTRGFSVISLYIFIGAIGFPVFANGKSGLMIGPTMGYLIGMLVASFVMGSLADAGWSKKFWTAYLATLIGSAITFSFGVLVLSYYFPENDILMAGVIPFLPGDFVKSILASYIAVNANQKMRL